MEDPASRRGCRGVRSRVPVGGGTGYRSEDAARQDRRVDADQRFFIRRARQGRTSERKAMIDRGHDLPIAKQAKALGISRGSVYYLPRPVPAADLAVMRRMDELHLELPFAGSRMLRDLLNTEGVAIGRCHVATLMKRLRIEALYRKPSTSKPAPGHKIYPYLLRGLTIDRPNQVWAMDITSVPMARGFVYLAAIIDWFSRRALSWRLSITMEAEVSRRGAGGSHSLVRQAGDLQYRPGLAVHRPRLHQRAARSWDRHQHGRQRRVARQRLRRAAVAVSQVRRDLPAGLRHRQHGARLDRPGSRLPPRT